MTDDEILLAAARIKARRAAEQALDSLEDSRDLMIRWTRPGVAVGANVAVPVTADQVRDLVAAHFGEIIAANQTEARTRQDAP